MTIQAAGPQPESSATPATKNAPPVIEPARTRAGADLWRAVARNQKHGPWHAALQTGLQSEADPDEGTDDTTIDTDEHSEEEGPDGTG